MVHLCIICFAQKSNDIISFNESFTLQNVDFKTIRYKKVRFAVHDEEMIYLQYTSSKVDSITFFQKNLKTGMEYKVIVAVPGLGSKNDDRRSYSAIDFNDNYVCFLLSGDFLIVLSRKGNKFKYESMIDFEKLKYTFNYFTLKKDKVYLCANYNFSTTGVKSTFKTCIAIYDLISKKITNDIRPEFNLIKLTHLKPSHYIDVSTNVVLFSQAIKPAIDLYDENLKHKDHIELSIPGWKEIDKKTYDSVIRDSRGDIPKWADFLMANYSRVFFAYGIDKENILISWYSSDDSLTHAKVSKKSGIWKIVAQKSYSIKYVINDTNKITEHDWLLYKNSFADLFIDDLYVYSIHVFSDKYPWELSAVEMKKYENIYYENNDPKMVLVKGKIK